MHFTAPPQYGEAIAQDVPLWMAARRLLYIAGIRLVAPRPESLAHFLRFFASYEHIHSEYLTIQQLSPKRFVTVSGVDLTS